MNCGGVSTKIYVCFIYTGIYFIEGRSLILVSHLTSTLMKHYLEGSLLLILEMFHKAPAMNEETLLKYLDRDGFTLYYMIGLKGKNYYPNVLIRLGR